MPWFPRTCKNNDFIGRAPARQIMTIIALLMSGLSPTYAQTQSEYLKSFDRDGDKRVSLQEFQDAMSWAFVQMDKNGDGTLTPNEQLVPKAKTFTLKEHHDRLALQFKKQDRNQDGYLSAKELAAPPQM
jgi:Ca2+-binding EF-hand superfamily protein